MELQEIERILKDELNVEEVYAQGENALKSGNVIVH